MSVWRHACNVSTFRRPPEPQPPLLIFRLSEEDETAGLAVSVLTGADLYGRIPQGGTRCWLSFLCNCPVRCGQQSRHALLVVAPRFHLLVFCILDFGHNRHMFLETPSRRQHKSVNGDVLQVYLEYGGTG